jgi:pilus assembly protein Flp/PilA
MNSIKKFINDEAGVTAIEYALLASLIAVAIIATATTLGTKIGAVFTFVTSKLKSS